MIVILPFAAYVLRLGFPSYLVAMAWGFSFDSHLGFLAQRKDDVACHS